jgi:hypothetical protein
MQATRAFLGGVCKLSSRTATFAFIGARMTQQFVAWATHFYRSELPQKVPYPRPSSYSLSDCSGGHGRGPPAHLCLNGLRWKVAVAILSEGRIAPQRCPERFEVGLSGRGVASIGAGAERRDGVELRELGSWVGGGGPACRKHSSLSATFLTFVPSLSWQMIVFHCKTILHTHEAAAVFAPVC